MKNKTYYIKHGTALFPSTHTEVIEHLPVGTWQVMFDPEKGFFLEQMENLTPGTQKIYGDITDRAKRILKTFNQRPLNTGVLLTGEKGSGKSLLARVVAELGRLENISTLVVNSAHGGEGFNQFLESINHPLMILFDEFDKVYDEKKKQAPLLSLFDGVASPASQKRLFMVTLNELPFLSDYLVNRPGRFYYHYSYDSIDETFVREYATDRLKNQDMVEAVVAFSRSFRKLNFDMLKAVIEEMNRYDETPNQVVKHLNVNPYAEGDSDRWTISDWKLKDVPEKLKTTAKSVYTLGSIDPLQKKFYTYVEATDDELDDYNIYFSPEDLVSYSSGKLVMSNEQAEITMTIKEKRRRLMEF